MQAMRDIVAKCLVKDPAKRPTAAQLLEHKFFKVRIHCVYLNTLTAPQSKPAIPTRLVGAEPKICTRAYLS